VNTEVTSFFQSFFTAHRTRQADILTIQFILTNDLFHQITGGITIS
jgi:hypothetical protein